MEYFKHEQAIVEPDAKLGEDSRVWAFAHVQNGAVVGTGCNICNGSFIENGAVVGNNVTIKHNVSIFDGITIEDDCFIGSNTAFINDRYPRSNRTDQWTLEKTVIKRGATLGSNAVILGNLTIGEYAVVGAGSVVTGNVPAYAICYGNPARPKGFACRCGRKLDENYQCSCSKKYVLNENTLKLDE